MTQPKFNNKIFAFNNISISCNTSRFFKGDINLQKRLPRKLKKKLKKYDTARI